MNNDENNKLKRGIFLFLSCGAMAFVIGFSYAYYLDILSVPEQKTAVSAGTSTAMVKTAENIEKPTTTTPVVPSPRAFSTTTPKASPKKVVTTTVVKKTSTTTNLKVNNPLSIRIFGMHVERPEDWPTIKFGSLRLNDTGSTWLKLEPAKGEWYFNRLDENVRLAQKTGADIILTLGQPPNWAAARPADESPYDVEGSASEPKNMEDWKNYIRVVSARYKGKIKYYEIWNEPNLEMFYTGTIPKMVELSKTAREVLAGTDPVAKILSPSPAHNDDTWLDDYFKAGGGNYVDVVGYHFYNPDADKYLVNTISHVKSVMARFGVDKPLWNTEVGWCILHDKSVYDYAMSGEYCDRENILSTDKAASYLVRTYLLSLHAGASRVYWYAWDDQVMGLTEADRRTPKKTALAFRELQNWLVGSEFKGCRESPDATWICEIVRPQGIGHIVWNPKKSLSFAIPAEWKAVSVTNVYGVKNVVGSSSASITGSPVLIE